MATDVAERVSWSEFQDAFVWNQGEHVTAIGPTGAGKTTLTNNLLPRRDYVIFAATKKKDKTVDWLKKHQSFREVKRIDQLHPEVGRRFIYKPDFPAWGAARLKDYHADFFRQLLMYVFRSGGWTLDLDEIRYLTEFLRLREEYELVMLQGRSLGITVISKTQRPKMIPLVAYDQATHLFLWRDNDQENLKRLASLGAHLDAREVRRQVAGLPMHEVLYLNTRTGAKLQTKVEV